MAQLNLDANKANNATISQGFDPIPAGHYKAHIIESIMKDTKANTGHYLELTYEILEGDFKGRRVWDRLNLVNSNDKAVEIAYTTLATITDVLGLPRVLEDSQALHGKPLTINVKQTSSEQYGVSNEIKGYSTADGSASGAAQVAQHQQAPQASKPPPWNK